MSFRLIAAAIITVAAASTARADVPAMFPVQGYLTLADGTPVDGPTTLHLSLYETLTDLSPLYSEQIVATVTKGFFTVYLGETAPIPLTIIRDASSLFLSMAVGGDPELQPRVRLASMPYAAVAEYCRDAESLNGASATDFATATHTHDWSELQNIPADIADGDADTTYSAGSGLTLAGTTFSVDTAAIQSRVSDSCDPGFSIRAIAANGTVTCQPDQVGPGTITGVSAGTGLSGGGTSGAVTLSADTAVLQRRVSMSCPAGSSIRAIDALGNVTCESDDDSGGTITGVTTGTGLTGGGTSGSVNVAIDPAQTQRRVSGSCGAGSFMRSVASDGTVACAADSDTMVGATVSAEFTAARSNTAGTTQTQLVSTTRSFCFLTQQMVRDTDGPAEGASCQIVTQGSNWQLEAVLEMSADADVSCAARCLTW